MNAQPAPRRPTVAVLGASADRSKYGNKAVRAYLARGYDVFPINPHASSIEGLRAYRSVLEVPEPLDRITVYVPPDALLQVLPELAEKGTRELFLNPGADREDVVSRARALGLAPILACSIVEIGLSPAQFA
jgi:predicted CoA-binding protein